MPNTQMIRTSGQRFPCLVTRQQRKNGFAIDTYYETNAADRRLKGIAWKGTGSFGIDYQSNALGQITQRSEEKVFDYGCDRLDRLSGITETQSGKQTQQTFRYDAADNLLKWSGIKHFDAQANSLNQVTTFNGNSLHYDAEGGLLQDDTRSYSWNAQGLPTQLGALKLEYDGLGKPIREDGQILIWCRDPGGEERICAKSSGIAKSDTPPVSIHNWGENDRKGKIGQVFYSKGNPNNDEGYFRLIGLGGDGRYWYYPSKGSKRNAWWQYLGSEAPQQEISVWGENDRRGKIGQIFQSLGGENHDFGYFRLIALGGDGRYWYYPNKGSKRNAWWEYLGTEIPADTEFYYTQGERRGNTAYAYVRDHLGSVVGLINSGGTLSDRAEYDAYGAARSGSSSARMGYAGMYKLGDQYLTRFWVYDTQTARWISRDPIAEAGGINLYGYVGGNPINGIDPTGLCECKGKARVLQGNRNHIGRAGGLGAPGQINTTSAALIPSQWGGKLALRAAYNGVSATNAATGVLLFDNAHDVAGGNAPVSGYSNVRDWFLATNPGVLYIELPGAIKDQGFMDVYVHTPNGMPCPDGTSPR